MLDYGTGVHDIKEILFKFVDCYVVFPHFQVALSIYFYESCVQVGSNNFSSQANTLAEPLRNRASSSANLETIPTLFDANCFKLWNFPWIENSLYACKSFTLSMPCLIYCIPWLAHSTPLRLQDVPVPQRSLQGWLLNYGL